MITAPHGWWTSPIDVALVTSPAAVRPSEPLLDRGLVYWLEARPAEAGRVTLCREGAGDLTPGFNVRSRVHEYGGGAYHVRDGVLVFNDLASGRVHRWEATGPVPITPENPALRYADLRVHPDRGLVLAVREDHSGEGQPLNSLVALSLSGPNADGGTPLCRGADFYAGPELAADGRLAWVEWNHPAMPWDGTTLRTARLILDDAGLPGLVEVRTVAGGPDEAAGFPLWCSDGPLLYASDRDGYSKPYREGDPNPLVEQDADLVPPLWVLGQRPWAESGDGTLRYAPWQHLGGIAAEGSRVAFVTGYPDRPEAVVVQELTTGDSVTLAGSVAVVDPEWVSRAEPVTWEGPAGEVQGWFYPPVNPQFCGPAGELPPLITTTHGGPTAFSDNSCALKTQFWTSRGFAVLDVNYSGSAGLGRAYRNRLRGQWGVLDVADVVAGARTMAERGRVDGRRLAIRGSSAGGYTTLRALTTSRVFTAGVSLYGIGDLTSLVTDTHKFESRYLDSLIGPWPEAAPLYLDRSPIRHLDQLNCPMLLLQGADDQVVPPSQARAMADAVRAKGLEVELIVFEGEGHGFRRAGTIGAALNAELAFYRRVFGR